MAKSIKLKNETYIDSTSIVHNKKTLQNILDNLLYKGGDTFIIKDMIIASFLTTGKTQIVFNIVTEKSMAEVDVSSIELTKCQIRHSDGGYIVNGDNLTTLGKISYAKKSTNTITVTFTLSTASDFTNNCPVTVWILEGTVNFK